MAGKKDHFELELLCDLNAAAKYYGISIEDLDETEYYTEFEVNPEKSNQRIFIQCDGCNEFIEANVIEIPRINNFKSSKFLIQIVVVLIFLLLPQFNLQVDEFSLYVLAGLAFFAFLYDVYTYIFKPPARVHSAFFWHSVISKKKKKESKSDENDLA